MQESQTIFAYFCDYDKNNFKLRFEVKTFYKEVTQINYSNSFTKLRKRKYGQTDYTKTNIAGVAQNCCVRVFTKCNNTIGHFETQGNEIDLKNLQEP